MKIQPLRLLVIRLACTHPADRSWIRTQLDPLACAQVDALLMEIADLGLDRDPAVLAAMLIEPDMTVCATSLRHPYWCALSRQTEAPALVAALTRRSACTGGSHVAS